MKQLSFFNFDQGFFLIEELFEAYEECRKNKRTTTSALDFEIDYEPALLKLCHEINTGSYQPDRMTTFILNEPVKREVFAADFRDRIVHHLVIKKLNPLFEKIFIYDSYACRTGKGTIFGIRRLDRFIRRCSRNYTRDCYVLKLDIQGFFMHIDRTILFNRLRDFIKRFYHHSNQSLLIDLCQKIINHDPTQNCKINGFKSDWDLLPRDKSLFHSPPHCGLPIGNLTSQIFANFYFNDFDHFIKKTLGLSYYGRYVDDFIIVHEEKEYLKNLVPKIKHFLFEHLRLTLHPKKIYLQHFSKGVPFLGAFIKPHRIYTQRRNTGRFYEAIRKQNTVIKNRAPTKEDQNNFLRTMNSYLGMMKHYRTYRLRGKALATLVKPWWTYTRTSSCLHKVMLVP
jgi:hypothetical protein